MSAEVRSGELDDRVGGECRSCMKATLYQGTMLHVSRLIDCCYVDQRPFALGRLSWLWLDVDIILPCTRSCDSTLDETYEVVGVLIHLGQGTCGGSFECCWLSAYREAGSEWG